MIRGKHWDDGWLTVYWGREYRNEPKDVMYGSPCRVDGRLMHNAFAHVKVYGEKTLLQELEERGYDITTLQFSVRRKWKPNEQPPIDTLMTSSAQACRSGLDPENERLRNALQALVNSCTTTHPDWGASICEPDGNVMSQAIAALDSASTPNAKGI